jgi:hypothetical protein
VLARFSECCNIVYINMEGRVYKKKMHGVSNEVITHTFKIL